MQELTLEETLARVERKIRSLYHTHGSVDDLVQEAHIHAWKSYQKGEEFSYTLVGAKYKVLQLISDTKNSHHWTGHIKADRVIEQASGVETREKIREYMDGYNRLHGHLPTPIEIAKHLGMARQTVRAHLERLYLFSGPQLTSVTSLDATPTFLSEDDGRSVADFIKGGNSFEDQLINKIDTFRWIKESLPDERERTFAYLAVFEDYAYKDIGALYGSSVTAVTKVVRKAMKRMREELNDQAD
jgi:DNA-directed RNA polymerase specialized sigma24 family protein